MTTELPPVGPPDAIDDLVGSLLDCGGVLSQIISGMVEWTASGRSAADAAPIPEIAHELIRSVATPVRHSHSKRDIKVAARIVSEMTTAMSNDIYRVDPEWLDAVRVGEGEPSGETTHGAEDAPTGDDEPWHWHVRPELEFDEDVAKFVVGLLNTGRVLAGLITNVSEMLPADAYPDEDSVSVAIEMVYGSIFTVLEEVEVEEVRRAAELIEQAYERTVAHLEMALELSRCLGGDGGSDDGPNDG